MLKTTLEWTPYPGHYPGQDKEDRFYGFAHYRGMHCELSQYEENQWKWIFFDDDGGPLGDPEVAIAEEVNFASKTEAEEDLLDYVDNYLSDKAYEAQWRIL